jgi:opacity protein-like surface antigen
MKKILILLILFCAWSAHAQTFIPKGGLTLSKIAADDDDGQKFNPGLTIGVAFNLPMSEVFSVQPELSFIQKGGRATASEEFGDFSYSAKSKVSLNYLEIPVLLKATFGESTKFFFTAGPSLGIGLGGKFEIKTTVMDQNISTSQTFDGKVKFEEEPEEDDEELDVLYVDNRLDFGMQLGAGVIIADKVMIDLRYGLGLSSLNDEVEDEDTKAQNRVIQFTVGVPIKLKK